MLPFLFRLFIFYLQIFCGGFANELVTLVVLGHGILVITLAVKVLPNPQFSAMPL